MVVRVAVNSVPRKSARCEWMGGWVDASPKMSVESKEEIEDIMSQKGFRNQDRVDKSGRSGGEDLGS